MSARRLDASWKSWLRENIERECNPEELLEILIKNSFTLPSIKQAMGKHFPAHAPVLRLAGEEPSPVDHEGICNVRLTRRHEDARIRRFPSDKIQLYAIENFMSAPECDAITKIIHKSLRPSTVTVESPGDKYYRTSSTSDLSLKDKPVKALDEKIARALGIRPAYSEAIQGQHYAVRQEFKQHTDFFEPGTPEYVEHAGKRGNRTWTFMVYLNNVDAGGGTCFLNLNHLFQPKKGLAVVWNNLYPDGTPNYDTLHAGMPVLAGHKTIITKWFRERGVGQMFYAD